MGIRKGPQEGEKLVGGKEFPSWLMNLFPSLTREDEDEFNSFLDSHSDRTIRPIESEFRKKFIEDGFDATSYRLNLVSLRKDFLKKAGVQILKNETGARINFTPLTLNDSVNAFFGELIAEHSAGGTKEEVYKRQKERAMERMILEEDSTLRKSIRWCRKDKITTIAMLISLIVLVTCAIYWIAYLLLA